MLVFFHDLSKENQKYLAEFKGIIEKIVEENAFILGDFVSEFETKFSDYLRVPFCVGVGSGTDALIIALRSLNIGPGDDVITVPNGFYASLEAILHVGATPVFVDVDPDSALIDSKLIKEKITAKTKAILPVHLYGQPADMDEIVEVAKRNNFYVVEDACQAHGATYRGKMAGTLGDIGCFSFYPTKNLGALGDGGAIVTHDRKIAERAMKLRNHGGIKKFEHELLGYNSRLDALQAAFLTKKLSSLNEQNSKRRKLALKYRQGLLDLPSVQPLKELPHRQSNSHLFVVRVLGGKRNAVRMFLTQNGIETGIHYPAPLHQSAVLLGAINERFPIAKSLCQSVLSLPLHPLMREDEVEKVVEVLGSALNL